MQVALGYLESQVYYIDTECLDLTSIGRQCSDWQMRKLRYN